jgi:hypothetical protein
LHISGHGSPRENCTPLKAFPYKESF